MTAKVTPGAIETAPGTTATIRIGLPFCCRMNAIRATGTGWPPAVIVVVTSQRRSFAPPAAKPQTIAQSPKISVEAPGGMGSGTGRCSSPVPAKTSWAFIAATSATRITN